MSTSAVRSIMSRSPSRHLSLAFADPLPTCSLNGSSQWRITSPVSGSTTRSKYVSASLSKSRTLSTSFPRPTLHWLPICKCRRSFFFTRQSHVFRLYFEPIANLYLHDIVEMKLDIPCNAPTTLARCLRPVPLMRRAFRPTTRASPLLAVAHSSSFAKWRSLPARHCLGCPRRNQIHETSTVSKS